MKVQLLISLVQMRQLGPLKLDVLLLVSAVSRHPVDCMASFTLLTLYLLVLSVHYFYKQFGTRSGPTKVGSNLDQICIALTWYYFKIFSKKLILKKNQ